MRTREQRWALRSARGWPRLRVHAIGNGLLAVLLGTALVYLTHGLLRFENFPAQDVMWVGRLLALTFAVLLPGVLTSMGAYLVFAGFAARHREATAAGQAHAVVVDGNDPDAVPVTLHKLTDATPRGVRIHAHRIRGRDAASRYTRDLLGALPVQSPIALAPLGVGSLLLTVATVYYATGYGRPALVVLLGVAYLGWKLWRGSRSYRAFRDGAWAPSPDEDTGALPRDTPPGALRTREGGYDVASSHRGQREREAGYAGAYRDEAEYEITDELPVIERIRDTYAEPRKRAASERRLAERAERERQHAERRDRTRREPPVGPAEDTTALPRTAPTEHVGRRGVPSRDYTVEQQEQLRQQEHYRRELEQRSREQRERMRRAEGEEQEEAQSLLGYARTRWRSRRGER